MLTIKNTDDNCFWYALNCLLYKNDEALYEIARKDDRPKKRAELGKQLCAKAGWEWNQPVPLDAIPAIEEKLGVGICVMSLDCVPVTGATTSIWDSLVYKTIGKFDAKHFLLLDEVNNHYDAIKCIKQFMGGQSPSP